MKPDSTIVVNWRCTQPPEGSMSEIAISRQLEGGQGSVLAGKVRLAVDTPCKRNYNTAANRPRLGETVSEDWG